MSFNTTTCNPAQDALFGPATSCQDFDFTLLFEQSVFGIGLSSLFLLLLPAQIFRLKRARIRVDCNIIYAVLVVLSIAIVGLQAADIVLWSSLAWIKTATAAAVVTAAATIGLAGLIAYEYRRSLRTSSLTLLFLLAICIGDILQLRTLASRYYAPDLIRVANTNLALKLTLLILSCSSKGRYLRQRQQSLSPEELSHVFGRGTFWWLSRLLWKGRGADLTTEQLYPLKANLLSAKLLDGSRNAWRKNAHRQSSAWLLSVCSILKWDFLAVVPPRLATTGFSFAQAYFIQACIQYLEADPSKRATSHAHGLVVAAALTYGGIALSIAAFNHQVYSLVTKYRGSTVALLQEKLLYTTTADIDSAIATLTSTDIDQSVAGLIGICDLWARVIEVGLGIWLLWDQIGPAAVAPVVIVALSFGLQTYLSRKLPARQGKWMMAVQQRIGFVVGLLRNIKSVKLAGLSLPLADMLQQKRVKEIQAAIPFRWMNVWVNSTANIPNLFSALIVFAAFSIQASISGGPPLSTAKAFTSLALIGLLTAPATQLLHSIPTAITALGCTRRIEAYLRQNTESTGDVSRDISIDGESGDQMTLKTLDRSAQRPGSDDTIIYSTNIFADESTSLPEVTLKVHRGETLLVTGPTGCGKSTFLKTLLGGVRTRTGRTSISPGYIGYCSQSPWLPNETIRRAIMGPHDYDETLYMTVLGVCELRRDIQDMPAGDGTIIGSKGSLLSGGQQQRVALARALYGRYPLLILDDPFSSLDERTAFYLARNLLDSDGFAKKHALTVVFASHDAKAIRWADQALVFSGISQVEHYGSAKDCVPDSARLDDDVYEIDDDSDHDPKLADSKLQQSKAPLTPTKRPGGDVRSWLYYGRAVGWWPIVTFLITIFLAAFGVNFQRLWLKWSTEGNAAPIAEFIGVYTAANLVTFLLMVAMLAQMMVVIAPRGAITLHASLTRTVMTAQLPFLLSTDISTIINRFSQDMTLADLALPATAFGFFLALAMCIIDLSFITTGSTYMAATIPLLILVVYGIQNFYLRTSRQMRLLDLEAKAPLYQSLSEVQEGLTTISALGWQTFCQQTFLSKLDESQKPYYLMFCIQRWLSLVLQLTVTGLAIVLVALALLVPSSTSGGSLGVALTSIMAFGSSLQAVIEAWTTTETTLAGVTRTRDFVQDTPVENDADLENTVLPDSWPQGGVQAKNLEITYATGAKPIVDLSFEIPEGCRLAVAGRTGSGKSSLLAALLRVIEPSNGTIKIDGIDITSIPHEVLRSRLICLPQDPLLFPGMPLRQNLTLGVRTLGTTDPTDDDISSALDLLDLTDLVTARGGLDAPFNPGMWSQGEQQLLAFARTIVRRREVTRAKQASETGRRAILLLDEPTSAMDAATEERFWCAVDRVFHGDTVLVVTHRRETMDRCDATLRLGNGDGAETFWREERR